MRNLIHFFIKYTFFFLFLLLEVFAFFLIVSNNSYQRSAFISSSNGFTSSILSAVSNATSYIGLKNENQQLAKENAILRSKLVESNLWSERNFKSHSDTIRHQFYTYKEAQIISNSFQNRNNFLILDKGSIDGIETEMGVISSNGIVGIVNDVSDHFCSVISILHKKSAIDVKITSNGYTGTTYWNGDKYTMGELKNIPSHTILSKGDTIVTSGNSAIFPPEIQVGYIKEYNLRKGQNFFDIEFEYSVDYNKIHNVYIIHNIRKEEIQKMKEGFDED